MALFAKMQGVHKIIAKVNEDTRAQMVEGLGIDSIVSAKSATADVILSSVSYTHLETEYENLFIVPSYITLSSVENQLLGNVTMPQQFRLKKQLPPYLRHAIFLAATTCSFHNSPLNAYYKKKRDQGKHHLTATGAVARKLTSVIYAVLRDSKPYEPKSFC